MSSIDMFRRFLIILACLKEGHGQSQTFPLIHKRIPDVIHEFCPDVNICSSNESIKAAAKYPCCEGKLMPLNVNSLKRLM
jgi:hypothetical protein